MARCWGNGSTGVRGVPHLGRVVTVDETPILACMKRFGLHQLVLSGLGGAMVVLASSLFATTASAAVHPSLMTSTSGMWAAQTPNTSGSSSSLAGVSALPNGDAYAVGQVNGQPLVEEWTGDSWVVEEVAAQYSGGYDAVDAVSSTDVWAVGAAVVGASVYPLVAHWNGSTWSTSVGSSVGEYFGVSVDPSTGNVWAVGATQSGGGQYVFLAECAACSSPSSTFTSMLSGTKGQLSAVAVVSSTNIFAVGYTQSGSTNQNLGLHYNGSSWSTVTTPDPESSDTLSGLGASSTGAVWAVGGSTSTTSSVTAPVALTWNGSSFVNESPTLPSTASGALVAATVLPDGQVICVGYQDAVTTTTAGSGQTTTLGPETPLVEAGNGTSWSQENVPSEATNGGIDNLLAVASINYGDVWVVGAYTTATGSSSPSTDLALQYTDADSYTVDALGGVHPVGSAPVATDTASFTKQLVTGIVTRPDGQSGYVLDGWGGVHPFGVSGDVPGLPTPTLTSPGKMDEVGIVLDNCSAGATSGYVVNVYGKVAPFGGAPAVTTSGTFSIPIVTALVVNSCADGYVSGYTVDGWGHVHPFVQSGYLMSALPNTNGAYWPGHDIIRAAVMGTTPGQGWTVDVYGVMHPFQTSGAVVAATDTAHFSTAIARGATVLASGTAGYIVDGWGNVHPWKATGAPQPALPDVWGAHWAGIDIVRGIS